MSSVDNDSTRILAKGKGRANIPDVDESTPLLASGSGLPIETDIPPRRRHLTSKLISVFLISLSSCVILLVLAVLIAYSYGARASALSPEDLQRSVRFRGPHHLDVVRIGPEGGVWLNIQGRVGVDAGGVVGVNDEEDDNLITYLWKSIGRWGIRRVDRISVHLSTVEAYSSHDFLGNVTLAPLELTLTANPTPDDTWLRDISIPLYLAPTQDSAAIIRFVRESWRDGFARVETVTERAVVRGGGLEERGWRTKLRAGRSNVHVPMRVKIPPVPGLPPPGHNDPLPSLSRLVFLQSFKIQTGNNHSESDQADLHILANATAMNPLPETVRYSSPKLPFTISLPNVQDPLNLIPVASVETAPFELTHPNISLSITGGVLPLNKNATSTVSTLLANYISLRDSEISISSPLFPYLTVDAVFPAKRPKPQILRNVTIRDMKIMPTTSGNAMLASGTIFARAVLPSGINPDINVTKVFPDVLIFDGEVPDQVLVRDDEVGGDLPPPHPLPDPLPERAFAHIRPDDWIPSTSVPVEADEGDGTTVEVFAKVVDIPLEVLPGRDREFRNFVGKVIFGSRGALAGVQGVAAVAVHIEGLPMEQDDNAGGMELHGLPFQGSVRIGKKSTFFDSRDYLNDVE